MKRLEFSLLMGGVILNALAQLLLKIGAKPLQALPLSQLWPQLPNLMTRPAVLAALCCYGLSVVVWFAALSKVAVSIAYPMLSIGYVITALLAWWLLGETPTLLRWIGMAVIIIGVSLVAHS